MVRDGVCSTLMEWMAAAESFQSQPEAFGNAMDLNRLAHIHRTRRMEPARGGEQRRNQELVPAQEAGEDADGDSGFMSLHLMKKRFTSA